MELLPNQSVEGYVAVLIKAKIPRCFGNDLGSGTDAQVRVTFTIGIGKAGEAQLTFKISAVDGGVVHMKMAVEKYISFVVIQIACVISPKVGYII